MVVREGNRGVRFRWTFIMGKRGTTTSASRGGELPGHETFRPFRSAKLRLIDTAQRSWRMEAFRDVKLWADSD